MRDVVLAFFGSLFPAILINVKKERFILVGLSGSLGWLAYAWMNSYTNQVVMSTFFGALIVGLFSEATARIVKTPALVFSVSGIFPLVPGIGAYYTVQYIVENRLQDAASKGIETIASAGSIALGIMFMSAIFKVITKIRRKIKNSTL